ncbi:hypothetical protein [Listeria booriae]|uniref:Uncharacterized protein n=1 Tax=Listeria booriae TaxID=1552123 RepID=A0A7X1BW92_9LIST|nr:hypothetical protein [Listeria booriae]MBC1333549.1 hypothetical protein [Listeria booriae]
MAMVEVNKGIESVYRLHMMRKTHGARHNKIIKAVIRLPIEIGEEELLVAMLRWKAKHPKGQLSVSTALGTIQYQMKDILSFKVRPYTARSEGERCLLLDEKACQELLQLK